MIASVTSFTDTVTNTRAPGPFDASSSRVFARKPSTSRFRCGVELYWRAPVAQWWFVAIRPSGETNEAVQPPSDTIAPIGCPVRSAKAEGSPWKPLSRSCAARSGICWGIHMPSSAARGTAIAKAASTASIRRGFFKACLLLAHGPRAAGLQGYPTSLGAKPRA